MSVDTVNIKDIQATVHTLDTRVSVLENRADTQSREMAEIRQDIKDVKSGIHRIFMSVIATLLTVVGSIIFYVFQMGVGG